MTRRDIEREYTVRDGQIVSPGKFEGEPVYAPYYSERSLDGLADDETHDGDSIFYPTEQERQMFPELGKARIIYLAELESGHVATDPRE